MDTILKDKILNKKYYVNINLKFLLSYLSILIIVIAVLNTYPIIISRDLVFRSKQAALETQANQISTSISVLDSFSQNNVTSIMGMLDIDNYSRVTVVNSDYDVLFQETKRDTHYETGSDSIIRDSMNGNDSFRSRFTKGAFISSVAVPIMYDGTIVGSVFLYEYDEEEGAIVMALQSDIRKISAALTVFTVIMSVLYSTTFTGRITHILNAIKNVREGEYSYRIDVKGHDELSQLSTEFNSLTNRLQVTDETRRRFVADASHELKTPLAAIRLLSDSIIETPNIDAETVKEFVTDIRDETERLARMTAQLLNLTKLDNNVAVVRTCVDCSKVAERAIRTLKPIADSGKVTITSELMPECFILASEDDIYEVLLNLAENAVKYNVEGGSVHIVVGSDGSSVKVSVSDTGVGIPERDMPYIFDRFYRVDKSRSREIGGTGLGLSIVKSTAERHGGEVLVERNPEIGMTFSVIFPLYSSQIK